MPLRALRSVLAALALLCAATPSHAANWFEMNFWLSGPRYSGKVPACDDGWALSSIQHKFSTKEGRFWNSALSIVGFDRIQRNGLSAMGARTRFRAVSAAAIATISDGIRRPVIT